MKEQGEKVDQQTLYQNTPFDRQVRIQNWDQNKLKKQTVLLLGVGGLGSVVMMNILRLGVKKLIIVDYDKVQNHNLNRQIMFAHSNVGEMKVDAAIMNSQYHNIGETEIEGFNGDALKNWKKIIGFAQQSDIVFNCIDYGDKFDAAVASLCMKLKLPLVMGGTFATFFTVDYISSEGKPCFLCINDEAKLATDIMEKIKPQIIMDLQDVSFLPKNDNPVGQSSVVVCTICGQLMVSHYLNYLFLTEENPYPTKRLVGYHNTFQIENFKLEREMDCLFCHDPGWVHPQQKFQHYIKKYFVHQTFPTVSLLSLLQEQPQSEKDSQSSSAKIVPKIS